jgi:hypothetical protein
MMARTAVVAGTATAVSNRVSRRQVGRWNQKADAQAYEEQQQAPPPDPEPQYQQPPPQYAPPPAPAAPAPAAPPNLVDELQRLSTLKNQGILSEDEFTAAKSKLLGI